MSKISPKIELKCEQVPNNLLISPLRFVSSFSSLKAPSSKVSPISKKPPGKLQQPFAGS